MAEIFSFLVLWFIPIQRTIILMVSIHFNDRINNYNETCFDFIDDDDDDVVVVFFLDCSLWSALKQESNNKSINVLAESKNDKNKKMINSLVS